MRSTVDWQKMVFNECTVYIYVFNLIARTVIQKMKSMVNLQKASDVAAVCFMPDVTEDLKVITHRKSCRQENIPRKIRSLYVMQI